MSDKPDSLFIAAASYASVDDAVTDYEAVKMLYHEIKASHDFDAAVIPKDEHRKVHIVKKHQEPTRHRAAHGLRRGPAAGALVAPFPRRGVARRPAGRGGSRGRGRAGR